MMLPFVSICDSSNSLRLPIWCIPVLLAINRGGNQSKFGNKGNSDSRFLTITQKIFHCTRKTLGFETEGHRSQFSVAFPQCCLPVSERTQPQALLLGITNRDCPGVKTGKLVFHRCETPQFRIKAAPHCLLMDHNPTLLFVTGA